MTGLAARPGSGSDNMLDSHDAAYRQAASCLSQNSRLEVSVHTGGTKRTLSASVTYLPFACKPWTKVTSGIIGPTMFTKSAAFYDLLYSFKDYAAEADKVRLVIDAANKGTERRLLDVACGTGQHLQHLKEHFETEGLDLDPGLLAVARRRLPELRFTHADMVEFDLGRRFDAVVC
jgi:SAM-dependent methyltransferase